MLVLCLDLVLFTSLAFFTATAICVLVLPCTDGDSVLFVNGVAVDVDCLAFLLSPAIIWCLSPRSAAAIDRWTSRSRLKDQGTGRDAAKPQCPFHNRPSHILIFD